MTERRVGDLDPFYLGRKGEGNRNEKEKRKNIFCGARREEKRKGAKEKGRRAGRKDFIKYFGLKFNSVI